MAGRRRGRRVRLDRLHPQGDRRPRPSRHDLRDRHRDQPRAAPRRRVPAAHDLLPRPGGLPVLDDVPHPPRLPRLGARGARRPARCSTASPCREDVADPARLALERMLAAKPPAAPHRVAERLMTREPDMVHVVVVGSGIAGLIVGAARRSSAVHDVTLVTKDGSSDAQHPLRAGRHRRASCSPTTASPRTSRDTLTAGAGLSDPDAVRVLVDEGPARIRELIALGVAFDRGADGALVQAASRPRTPYPRILHAGGDATGAAIEEALVARLRASDVRVHRARVPARPRASTRTVAASSGVATCCVDGTVARRIESRPTRSCSPPAARASSTRTRRTRRSRPATASPPRIRAGADVADLEFFQFHPTALAAPGDAFLVSEAVRGEGAVLHRRERPALRVRRAPDGELAPRDVVARAIARQMAAQDGRPVLPRRDAAPTRGAPRVPRAPLPDDRPGRARAAASTGRASRSR